MVSPCSLLTLLYLTSHLGSPEAGPGKVITPPACMCFRALRCPCARLNPQYPTDKTLRRNQRALCSPNTPGPVSSSSSNGLCTLSDLLGNHRTYLARTVSNGACCLNSFLHFVPESRVSVLFLFLLLCGLAVARIVGLVFLWYCCHFRGRTEQLINLFDIVTRPRAVVYQ